MPDNAARGERLPRADTPRCARTEGRRSA